MIHFEIFWLTHFFLMKLSYWLQANCESLYFVSKSSETLTHEVTLQWFGAILDRITTKTPKLSRKTVIMHRMMNIAIARMQRAFAHVSINIARARLVLISFVDKNSWISEIFAIIKFPMCEKVYYLLTYLRKVDRNHTLWYAIIKTLLTSRSM